MHQLFFITLFLACNGEQDSEEKGKGKYGQYGEWSMEEKPQKPLLVKYTSVGKGQVSEQLETTGTLESIEQANVIPEANGTIQEIFVREGDAVNKGQALATLINPSLDASVERAKIELVRATRESDKAKSLHTQGAISDREHQEAEAALQTAESAFIEATRSKGFTTLRSPVAGVVAFVDIREGELAAGTRAFQVVNPQQLRIVANVPEQDLNALSISQKAVITSTYDETIQVPGYIERIAPVVDPTTGTVKVFINLEPDQNLLRPGQFVRAQIETDIHDNVLVLPKSAIVYKDGEAIAYVVEEAPPEEEDEADDSEAKAEDEEETENENDDGETADEQDEDDDDGPKYIAVKRRLELGFIDAENAEIISGLEENEQVVTIGNAAIKDNSPIRIFECASEDCEEREDDNGERTPPSEEAGDAQ